MTTAAPTELEAEIDRARVALTAMSLRTVQRARRRRPELPPFRSSALALLEDARTAVLEGDDDRGANAANDAAIALWSRSE